MPRVSARTQLVLAMLLWLSIAAMLGIRGVSVLVGGHLALWLLVTAVALGIAKSRFLLDGVAERAARRMIERGRDACAGGFFSARQWMFAGVMIAVGLGLRFSPLPRSALAVAQVAVATALVATARVFLREALRA